MARQTTCPRCRMTVTIQDDSDPQALSCPRCLAPLAGSQATAIQAEAPVAAGVTPMPAPGVAPLNVSTSIVPSVDRQAIQDSKRGVGCMSTLIGLTIVGIILTVVVPKRSHDLIGTMLLLMLQFGILDVLVLIQIIGWLKRRSARTPSPHDGGESLLKTVTMIFAFLGLALATVVFFFFACLGAISTY
jgi:hypothetical protein